MARRYERITPTRRDRNAAATWRMLAGMTPDLDLPKPPRKEENLQRTDRKQK